MAVKGLNSAHQNTGFKNLALLSVFFVVVVVVVLFCFLSDEAPSRAVKGLNSAHQNTIPPRSAHKRNSRSCLRTVWRRGLKALGLCTSGSSWWCKFPLRTSWSTMWSGPLSTLSIRRELPQRMVLVGSFVLKVQYG